MKYLLISSPRSGSALLKHSLIKLFNENTDGPDEWIVHPVTRKNLNLPSDYTSAQNLVLNNMESLVNRMSSNSHRKVMYNHIHNPLIIPKNLPIIHLIRRDSFAQAKSEFLMKKKIIPPHINQDIEKKNYKNEIAIDYNFIGQVAKQKLESKLFWFKTLRSRSKTLTIFYEDDLVDETNFLINTLPIIEEFLEVKSEYKNFTFPFKKTSNLHSISNLNIDLEKKFKEEFYFQPNKLNTIKYFNWRLYMAIKKWQK